MTITTTPTQCKTESKKVLIIEQNPENETQL